MRIEDIREHAFAMPLTSPAYPKAPFSFVDREFLNITCRTDPQRLRAVVPEVISGVRLRRA